MGGRQGRAPSRWSEARVKLIKEHFVALAIRSGEQTRKDADGEFIRECGLKLAGAGGNLVVVTANGKQLGGKDGEHSDVEKAWDEWSRLPESQRKPGAVKVGDRGPIDAAASLPEPPSGGLILRLYYRSLARDSKGILRHINREDFAANLAMARSSSEKDYINSMISNASFYEAQPDHVWLTKDEWKSLLPENPRKGEMSAVPAGIRERIFRYHLVPRMAFAESNGWDEKGDVRGGKLTLTVEEVSAEMVRLRLDGFALLGPDFTTVTATLKEKRWVGYEPRLLGYLEYHPAKQAISRFDFVALGDTYGMLEGDNRFYYRPKRQPLGVAFELVSPDVPANRIPPRATRGAMYKSYFATGK
jgi:hypothetical protein